MVQGQTGGKSLVLTFRDSFFFLFLFFKIYFTFGVRRVQVTVLDFVLYKNKTNT